MASAGGVVLFWPDRKQRRLDWLCWNNHGRRMEERRRPDDDYCTIFSRRSANALGQVVSGSGLIKTFLLCPWTFTSHFVTECWQEFAQLHPPRSASLFWKRVRVRVLAGPVDSPRLKKSPRRFPKPRSLGALALADICILLFLMTGQIENKNWISSETWNNCTEGDKKNLYELTKMSKMWW